MGTPQGLAKYQARRINTTGAVPTTSQPTTQRPSGMFNQVPAPSSGDSAPTSPHNNAITTGGAGTVSTFSSQHKTEISAAKAAQLSPEILDLAKRYLDLFQGGKVAKMNAAEKSALVLEIAAFYSHPTREGRLETLVTALSPQSH